MTMKEIARIAHEIKRAYCRALGDESQVAWEKASQWQKKNAMDCVQFLWAFPDATPEDSHNAWLQGKYAAGWCYGAEKNSKKKTHPCCVSFDALPAEQQAKDFIFHAVVNLLLEHLDQEERNRYVPQN